MDPNVCETHFFFEEVQFKFFDDNVRYSDQLVRFWTTESKTQATYDWVVVRKLRKLNSLLLLLDSKKEMYAL